MKFIIISIIVVLNLILQSTTLQWFNILGTLPNTAIILVISFAVHSGKKQGAIIGFFVGLLQDITFGRIIGMNALAYMLIGYTVGLTEQKIFKGNILIPIILTGLATIFYELMNLLLIFLLGYRIELLNIFKKMLIVELIYNCILSPILYFYVSKLFKLDVMKKRQ
ncbi:rod shape-determining protein MreD [Alkaliphilus oremlandii]|uniref:Uncharacterized protein n=1 Tax=Alkaliphilus oremlandii (strain OhILAs) TaxID=350688 RepID=A8MHM1_ALKOO|nr:rod shape-determining protein MreD [Alkaliphilus oremlandii]ABW19303.1 conserved hypothetical protein [Alkaliphilus oremlandii OhILAs]